MNSAVVMLHYSLFRGQFTKKEYLSFIVLQMSKEEIARWEEGKKWQARVEKIRYMLKEKESEVETLSKQLKTIKDLYNRFDSPYPLIYI